MTYDVRILNSKRKHADALWAEKKSISQIDHSAYVTRAFPDPLCLLQDREVALTPAGHQTLVGLC